MNFYIALLPFVAWLHPVRPADGAGSLLAHVLTSIGIKVEGPGELPRGLLYGYSMYVKLRPKRLNPPLICHILLQEVL